MCIDKLYNDCNQLDRLLDTAPFRRGVCPSTATNSPFGVNDVLSATEYASVSVLLYASVETSSRRLTDCAVDHIS